MFEAFQNVNAAYPWFFASISFVFGAVWGSFFNVVIYRLPRQISVISPPSHCFSCGAPIKWYDNLPILGWVLLRGKARCCGAPFSCRYAVIELLTGLLFLACWLTQPPLVALVGFVFIGLMLTNSFIDLDTQELYDGLTVGGAAVGLMLSVAVPALHGHTDPSQPWVFLAVRSMLDALLGMFIGSGLLLWIALFAEKIFRKEAMGFGDVLLMGCIGAFCGWQGTLVAIFGGAFLGTLGVVMAVIWGALTGHAASLGKMGRAQLSSPSSPAKATEPTEAAESANPTEPANTTDSAKSNNLAEQTDSAKTNESAQPANTANTTARANPANPAKPANAAESPNPTEAAMTTEPDKAVTGSEATPPEDTPKLAFGTTIPFGPWLSLAALLYFLFLRDSVERYLADFAMAVTQGL